MAGIFVRGLTGNKVNVFVDGVRYSNGAQRGGVNTFLDLIDPSVLEGIEVLRGPNSAAVRQRRARRQHAVPDARRRRSAPRRPRDRRRGLGAPAATAHSGGGGTLVGYPAARPFGLYRHVRAAARPATTAGRRR